MTADERPLFRPEAVEHHARGGTERRTLDLGERRVSWAFRGLLVAVVLILAAGTTMRADTKTKGDATVAGDGRTASVRLPIGALGRVERDQPVTIDLPGDDVKGRVSEVGTPIAGGGSALVPVTVALDAPAAPSARGRAVVRLGRHTLAELLLGLNDE